MFIAKIMTVYGVVGIVAAALAFMLAHLKGRDPGAWAVASFLLPPALFALIMSGKGDPVARHQKKTLKRIEHALTDD